MGRLDPRLLPLRRARSESEAEREIERLLGELSLVVRRVLRGRLARGPAAGAGEEELAAEEMFSSVLLALAGTLQRQREPEAAPIESLTAYAATAAYHELHQWLRLRSRSRHRLKNRLRDLLEGPPGRGRFARWSTRDGEWACGLAGWRGRPVRRSGRYGALVQSPVEAAGEALARATPAEFRLAELLERLLRWVGEPVEFSDLLAALAQVVPGEDPGREGDDSALEFVADSVPTPEAEAEWTDLLRWLVGAIRDLPLPQRRAFLLGSPVLEDLFLRGVAGADELARLTGLDLAQLAGIWGEIPLDDVALGRLTGDPPGTEAKRRFDARVRLRRALALRDPS